MIFFSVICRLYDGLPLVSDTDYDASCSEEIRGGALAVCHKLAADPRIPRDTPALIISDHPYIYYVLTHSGVACVALCDCSAAPTSAFAFLDEMLFEFMQQYGRLVDSAVRPYAFLSFDACLQSLKRLYIHSASVAKQMPARMAALPPPRRALVEDILVTSPQQRRGSGSRHSSPTTSDVSKPHQPVFTPLEPVNEFMMVTTRWMSLWEEIQDITRERWPLITFAVFGLAFVNIGLFFAVAYLFE